MNFKKINDNIESYLSLMFLIAIVISILIGVIGQIYYDNTKGKEIKELQNQVNILKIELNYCEQTKLNKDVK